MKRTLAGVVIAASMAAAILGVALVGLSFSSAQAHECPKEGCFEEGRMTGGGRLNLDTIVTHGFELHCNVDDTPNNLEINWDGGNKFHLDELTRADCIDDPSIAPKPPTAAFDLFEGGGTGSYNGEDGATIYFVLTDAGEPGTNDHARFLIRNADGDVVLNVSSDLEEGNHQAHNDNSP